MNRKFGISVLILCFGLSNVNLGLASDMIIEVPPVVVQPYDMGCMNQHMFEMDRENQEKAVAIRALAKENQKIADAALAQKQKTTLEQIDYAIIRSQRISKYDELINLTEDVDRMKGYHDTVVLKSDVIEEKYKILTDLENEMMELNKKLNNGPVHEDLGTLGEQQSDKIQLLGQRLGEMDQKIVHYNDVLADKDQKIAQLVDNLAQAKSEAMTKDEVIKEEKNQVDLLKSELENKITETKSQASSIAWLNKVLIVTKNEAKYYKLTSQQDHLALLKIQREMQGIKDGFERHSKDYDQMEKTIFSLKGQVSDLGLQVSQKQGQIDMLELELKNKISESKDEVVLTDQIQDLKSQLQDKEDQITAMRTKVRSGQETKQEAESLKEQLAMQQDKVDQLKQQLEIKTAQSDQMGLMVDEYQRKLEAKNNAYNEQLSQVTSTKNDQTQLEKQIIDLNARLQDKEAQIVKIKKDLYDLQESNRGSQAQDLNSSLTQQKTMDKKINDYQAQLNALQALSQNQAKEVMHLKAQLALERQGLNGIPNSDELNFLRTAYRQASADLELKDKMFHETQANFLEYQKEFREQTKEFHSLSDQLQAAKDEIKIKDEDLRYKGLEILRLKGLYKSNQEDLQLQIRALTKRLEAAEKGHYKGNTHEKNVKVLQEQLERENLEIKELQDQLNEFKSPSSHDALVDKLTQALGKIDQQGQMINTLSQKLLDCGQSVDFSKQAASSNTNTPGVQKLF